MCKVKSRIEDNESGVIRARSSTADSITGTDMKTEKLKSSKRGKKLCLKHYL